MNIKFNKVIIENFFSIGHSEVELNDQGFVIVSGQNENPVDNAKSNGSGKSAIFEAIMWALTGNTVRGTTDVVNKYVEGGTYVGLDFEEDGNHYKILRSREHKKWKTNLKIFVNGEDKSGKGIRDGEKILAEYLPDLTVGLLGATTILGQGLPQRLTNNTPSGRKGIIENFANANFMCEELKERVATTKAKNSEELKNLESKIVEYTTEKKLSESRLSYAQTELSKIDIESMTKQIIASSKARDKIDAEIKSLSDTRDSKQEIINKFLETYEELNNAETKEWNETESLLPTQESIIAQFPTSDQIESAFPSYMDIKKRYPSSADIDSNYSEQIDSFTSKIRETDNQIAVLEQDIKTKDSVTDICPTCGQKIPNVVKFDTQPLKKKLGDLRASKTLLENAYKSLWTKKESEKVATESQINEEYSKVTASIKAKKESIDKEKNSKLSELSAKKTSLREEIRSKYSLKKEKVKQEGSALRTEITSLEQTINTKKAEKEKISTSISYLEIQKQNAEKQKSQYQKDVIELSQKISDLEKKILYTNSSKDEVNRRIEIDSKMKTFLERDFRGLLIANIIDFIQSECYKFGDDIFHTRKIDFYLDNNDIFIGYNGKDYASLSGGEKQKVDVIVQFALRSMLCQLTGFSTNILVLDEITDGLDATGCQEVINCVTKNLSDVSSIYIISHRTDLNLPCDKQLIVKKNSLGISSVIS